jgi:hypothetical protein
LGRATRCPVRCVWPGCGDAEDGHTELGTRGGECGLGVGDEPGDGDRGPTFQPDELHVGQVAFGATHVVVEDVVEAKGGRFPGEVDLVLADVAVGEVGEGGGAIVVGERPAAGAVQHEHVGAAVGQGPPGGDGVEEADDASDHPDTERVELVDSAPGVVMGSRGTDRLGERHRAGVANFARFVFDVELDRVDPSAWIRSTTCWWTTGFAQSDERTCTAAVAGYRGGVGVAVTATVASVD